MCMLGATSAGPRYFSVTNLHALVIGHVCSDNGGPARMANNMPLRGAKFGVFEGSFRVPAFVHSALLPAAVVGTVSHELFHITDLYATIAGLAGVDLGLVHNGSGPVPPDGMDVWSAIAGGDTSPRTTIVHEYDPIKGDVYAFRSGERKLIWGKIGDADWIADVSYDTGCTPLLPPINTSLLGRAPVGPVFASEDHLPASTSAGAFDLTCTADKPCLFDVINDPTERHEVAAQQPSVVKRLQAELGEHLKNRYTGQLDRAKTSEADYCDFIERVKWVQPYDDIAPRPSPSPTPIPPAVAAELTGTWAQGWQLPGRLPEMMAVSVSSATGALAVQPINCTGCCWSSAVGSFLPPSDDTSSSDDEATSRPPPPPDFRDFRPWDSNVDHQRLPPSRESKEVESSEEESEEGSEDDSEAENAPSRHEDPLARMRRRADILPSDESASEDEDEDEDAMTRRYEQVSQEWVGECGGGGGRGGARGQVAGGGKGGWALSPPFLGTGSGAARVVPPGVPRPLP